MLNLTDNEIKTASQEEVSDIGHDMSRKMQEFANRAKSQAHYAAAVTEKQIKDHPLRMNALAIGIGFLLGLMHRSR